MNRLQFITAIQPNIERGSGCYVGTRTLGDGLRKLGTDVEMVRPRIHLPLFTATRVLFNEALRWRDFTADATIGIDVDGYAIAGRRNSPPHIACIKGVLGDAVRFESGVTRASMALQSRLEAKNARRAELVITISRYCAERIEELYGIGGAVVVPEVIDLRAWRDLFHSISAVPEGDKFTVFSVSLLPPKASRHSAAGCRAITSGDSRARDSNRRQRAAVQKTASALHGIAPGRHRALARGSAAREISRGI